MCPDGKYVTDVSVKAAQYRDPDVDNSGVYSMKLACGSLDDPQEDKEEVDLLGGGPEAEFKGFQSLAS